MISADVAVVGGGIAGASVAAELAPHCQVVLLERESMLGYHTTSRSAAQFQESNGPGIIGALTRASRPVFDAMADEIGTPVLRPRQTLWVARDSDSHRIDALLAHEAVERTSVADARSLCPALRKEYVTAAAVERGAQDIDVDLAFQRYLRVARQAGTQVLRSAELVAARRDRSRWLLETTQGAVTASTVVNAAGAWADQVAGMLGARPLGLGPLRRTALVAPISARPVDAGWPMVADVANRFYFRPEGQGVLASPADETPTDPSDVRPDALDIALTLDRLNSATDLQVRSVHRAWAGLRTFAPDRLPVVGFDMHVQGLVWLAGQGGYGIQTAPALAQIAASIVTTGAPPATPDTSGLDALPLRPSRFDQGS